MEVEVTKKLYSSTGELVKIKKPKIFDSDFLMLNDREGARKSWGILGFDWNYICSQTSKGYRITETVIRNRKTNEVEINIISYE